MAQGYEVGRTVFLKRLIDPSDPDPTNPTNYIDVPCIVSIYFEDPGDGQVYQRILDSTAQNNTRQVHTKEVGWQSFDSDGSVSSDTSNQVMVERIDETDDYNPDYLERVQLIDQDPAPLPPPSDPSYNADSGHWITHVVRYNKDNINDPDATPWVDIEVADAIKLQGFLEQRHRNTGSHADDSGQVFTLNFDNDPGDQNFTDPNDPYPARWADINYWSPSDGSAYQYMPQDTDGATPDANGNPAPVRLDPFQNIVNINWSGGLAVEFLTGAA